MVFLSHNFIAIDLFRIFVLRLRYARKTEIDIYLDKKSATRIQQNRQNKKNGKDRKHGKDREDTGRSAS